MSLGNSTILCQFKYGDGKTIERSKNIVLANDETMLTMEVVMDQLDALGHDSLIVALNVKDKKCFCVPGEDFPIKFHLSIRLYDSNETIADYKSSIDSRFIESDEFVKGKIYEIFQEEIDNSLKKVLSSYLFFNDNKWPESDEDITDLARQLFNAAEKILASY
ncbi:MAG: hypothetical protein LBF38_01475 [Deltaproteobacteria bacterium]|jgi:hypothetical protein|nr:hypothetical protein [Deltaproteobacteria bacterium]